MVRSLPCSCTSHQSASTLRSGANVSLWRNSWLAPGGRHHPEQSASFAHPAVLWQNSVRMSSTSWARACGDRQREAALICWKERDPWHTTCFKAGMHRRRGPA